MDNILVSIIIPTYNYAHLIIETLESVRRQSYPHWECLIIDDGSTDSTAVVITDYLQLHSELPFQYIPQENSGTSAAKNKGIALAKGSYIQFLDADDLLSPAKLESGVRLLIQERAELVFSASRFFREVDGRVVEEHKYPEGFLATETLGDCSLLKRLTINNIVTISAPIISLALLRDAGGFDRHLLNNEDWLLWFRVALIRPYFLFDANPKSYVNIRLHGHSAMNQHRKMFLGEEVVRLEMASLLRLQAPAPCSQSLRELNSDLLALHRVRSLNAGKGMSYIIGNFIARPSAGLGLLKKGVFKLMVRVYKGMLQK